MLEIILKKLGFDSVEEFFNSEKKYIDDCNGMEVDRPNPLSVLTFDEIDFFQEYVNSNNLAN